VQRRTIPADGPGQNAVPTPDRMLGYWGGRGTLSDGTAPRRSGPSLKVQRGALGVDKRKGPQRYFALGSFTGTWGDELITRGLSSG
jgi:hypothetical protein